MNLHIPPTVKHLAVTVGVFALTTVAISKLAPGLAYAIGIRPSPLSPAIANLPFPIGYSNMPAFLMGSQPAAGQPAAKGSSIVTAVNADT